MQLTVLGGGGIRTPLFINGLAHSREHAFFDRVVLYDTDEERVSLLGSLNKFIVEKAGAPFELHATSDIKEALTGTDFVFSAIRVGQDEARVLDESIPLKYGVLGQETVGPGGFAMALRTIPVMRDYAEQMKKYAPEAWLLNFTNPAGIITEALADIGIKTVGICDSPSGLKRRLARFMGVSNHDVDVQYFGLNHLGWMSSVKVQGVEKLGFLLDHYEELRAWDAEFRCFDTDYVRHLGCLPNEYLYYFYSSREALQRVTQSGSSRGRQVQELNRGLFAMLRELIPRGDFSLALEQYQATMGVRNSTYMQRETSGHSEGRAELLSQDVFAGGYEEVALNIIGAFVQKDRRSLILNVPNQGALPYLRNTDVVEVSVEVSTNNIRPLAIGSVPDACQALMLQVKDYERLTIEAAKSGDTRLACIALATHPLVPSLDVARLILKDYLTGHAQYLAQFQS